MAIDDGAKALARALRRADKDVAARVLADSASAPRSPALEALAEVFDAPTRAHAVAAINEHLSGISGELDGAGEVPRAGARISLASGTFLGLLRVATGLGADGQWLTWALVAFAGGLLGAGVSMGLARRSERAARDRREAWNRLSGLLGALAPAEPGVSKSPTQAV